MRLRRDAHAHDQFARMQLDGFGAVVLIKVGQWQRAQTGAAQKLQRGVQGDQRWRQVAAPGGVTARALWRDVAGVAAVLEAVVVRLAPPLALVVKNAARENNPILPS